jgi:hypothetical protein
MQWWKVAFFVAAVSAMVRPLFADDAPPDDRMHLRQAGVLHIYSVGTIEPDAWKHFTPDQQKANVEGLKQFAEKGMRDIGTPMPLLETPHFLIYCGEGAKTAQEQAGLLEISYRTLVNFFNITSGSFGKEKAQGPDVWRGKALIFLCRDEDRYHKLMSAIHPPGEEPEAIVLNGNGSVDIAMPSVDTPHEKRVLIFAMVEGFLFRYHSPKPLPAWITDGLSTSLADTTPIEGDTPAVGMIRDPEGRMTLDGMSINYLKGHNLDDILDDNDNEPMTRVVCDSLTTFMVRRMRYRYPTFILGLKDGMEVEKALKQKYGLDRVELKSEYLNYLSRLR